MKRTWSLGLIAALSVHGLAVAAMLVPQTLEPPPPPIEAAIMIELPPAPQPQEPQPTPKPVTETPPKPPKPKEIKPRKVKAVAPQPVPRPVAEQAPQIATEPPVEPVTTPPEKVEETAAPVRPAANPLAVPNWQSQMLAHLERHKLYPHQAQNRRLRGMVVLSFTMDRMGRVQSQSVRKSSGHALLDQAALDMLTRAQPLPPPPPEVEGAILTLAVPVKFTLN